MRAAIFLLIAVAFVAATTSVQAQPNTQSGKPAACKAPWGEPFGLGETIDLHETDAKGNIVKVTYQCTDNGWVKVSKRALGGGTIRLTPESLQAAFYRARG